MIFISASHQAGFDPRSLYSGDIEEGEGEHEPKLVPCWTVLVIRTLGEM